MIDLVLDPNIKYHIMFSKFTRDNKKEILDMYKSFKTMVSCVIFAAALQACDDKVNQHDADGAVMQDGDVMMVDGGYDAGIVDSGPPTLCDGQPHFFTKISGDIQTNTILGVRFYGTQGCGLGVSCYIYIENNSGINYKLASLTITDPDNFPSNHMTISSYYANSMGMESWSPAPGNQFYNVSASPLTGLIKLYTTASTTNTRNLFTVDQGWNPLNGAGLTTFEAMFSCAP